MKFSAVVFDLDGTLLNTIDDLRDCTNYALTAHGFPTHSTEQIKCFVGNGIHRLLCRAVPDGEDNPLFGEVEKTFLSYYDAHCADKTAPYDGIAALLARLHEAGVKTAVVTNKVQSAAEELVRTMFPGISIVVGDSPAVKRKPNPEGVWRAMRLMGVTKEEAVYVGDSDVDCATARNAGLPCLSVLWGFRSRAQLEEAGATAFFATPQELGDYLLA